MVTSVTVNLIHIFITRLDSACLDSAWHALIVCHYSDYGFWHGVDTGDAFYSWGGLLFGIFRLIERFHKLKET